MFSKMEKKKLDELLNDEKICIWFVSSVDLFGKLSLPKYCRDRLCTGYNFLCKYYIPNKLYKKDRGGCDEDQNTLYKLREGS